MLQLARTNNSQASFVIAKTNYTQLYHQLKKTLPESLHTVFAKPDVGANFTLWLMDTMPESATVRSFSTLSEEEKNWVATEIEDKKAEIVAMLSGQPLFAAFYENLFIITDQNDIKLVENGDERFAVLTQWACKSSLTKTTINPLTTALDRPNNNRSNVTISVNYNNGDIYSELPFLVEYKGLPKPYKTDEQGFCQLGKFMHGSEINVFFSIGGKAKYAHPFIVSNQGLYSVIVPRLADVILTVVNQDGEPLPDISVNINYQGQSLPFTTTETGTIVMTDVEVGETIMAAATAILSGREVSGEADFTIETDNNNFQLKLRQPKPANLTIKTVDQNDKALPNIAIEIQDSEGTARYETDENGLLLLKECYEIDQNLVLNAVEYPQAKLEHRIAERETVLVWKIILPEPQFVQVRLIDHKNNPLPAIPIDFSKKGGQESKTTDAEALCFFPLGSFVQGEKVKAKIHIPKKDKKGNVKTKIYRKSFRYDTNQQAYTLKLSKRRWWWLLLLLPLLLLIQCEKTVPVKVIDAQSSRSIAQANVHFQYYRQNLFRPWAFFTNDSTHGEEVADSLGVATFTKLRYSLYSLIFYNQMRASVSASCNCYATDTIQPRFHYIGDTLLLKLNPAMALLDFLVVDSFDNEPLPQAIVTIRAEFAGGVYSDTAISDPAGMVYFKKIPQCATNIDVYARKTGYYPDSILHKSIPDLTGDLRQKRTLKLIPEKAKITFFVEDCETGERLPGATVIIDIEGKRRKQRAMTNVNGIGKGEYDDTRLTDEIELIAEYPPHYRPGRLPKYKVRDFIRLPDSLRTICLEPLPEACNSQHKSGGAGITTDEYDMKDPNMKFNINFNMFSVPDRMIVYCGRKGSPGKVLYDTGYRPGTGTLPVDMSVCGGTWITIKVMGPQGTDWNYDIDCQLLSRYGGMLGTEE